MAIIFANILPDDEYSAVRSGQLKDVKSTMSRYNAVKKLYNAGIVGGNENGEYKPDDEIRRSEACKIFTCIVVLSYRSK